MNKMAAGAMTICRLARLKPKGVHSHLAAFCRREPNYAETFSSYRLDSYGRSWDVNVADWAGDAAEYPASNTIRAPSIYGRAAGSQRHDSSANRVSAVGTNYSWYAGVRDSRDSGQSYDTGKSAGAPAADAEHVSTDGSGADSTCTDRAASGGSRADCGETDRSLAGGEAECAGTFSVAPDRKSATRIAVTPRDWLDRIHDHFARGYKSAAFIAQRGKYKNGARWRWGVSGIHVSCDQWNPRGYSGRDLCAGHD